VFIDSFNINEKDKSIWIYGDNENILNEDYSLYRDDSVIYIIDNKEYTEVVQISFYIDHYINISLDENNKAKITYLEVIESLVGENYMIPQAEVHEMYYVNGYYKEQE